MAKIEKTVFISYRRKDISWALAVYQYLTSQKYDVFFDFSSIPSGDFEQIIVSNIKARAHFVLILTPTALERCNEPGDWLKREIEIAIDEKRNIIPLFFDDFSFGLPAVAEKITGKLGMIKRYNGLDIPSGYFIEAMERLNNRYLNVPLDSVLHPVPTEVRKVVKDEQVAANQALIQKSEDIKELIKPALEKINEAKQELTKNAPIPAQLWKRFSKDASLRRYGISAGILILAALGIFGVKSLIPNTGGKETSIPTLSTQLVSTFTRTSVPSTQTRLVPTSTETSIPPTSTFTPTPTLGVGSIVISSMDGMTLLYVPAGEFRMGILGQESDEKPIHTVYLDAYWIDQTEVTNAMYAKCVSDGKCDRPKSFGSASHKDYYGNSEYDNYPVIFVSWENANSYCSWADRRLPTEAEWEKAARGKDQRNYPWGEKIDCTHANYLGCVGDTQAVKSYFVGRSFYGLYDMAGNVWEWVADWYGSTYYSSLSSPVSNPLGPAKSKDNLRVARGGSWSDTDFLARSSNRGSFDANGKSSNKGFRCAMPE